MQMMTRSVWWRIDPPTEQNAPAADTSTLYARNLFNVLDLLYDQEARALAIDWDDEIVKGMALTRDGEIVHPAFTD